MSTPLDAPPIPIDLRGLKLRSGMALQIQRQPAGPIHEALFLAAISGKGVMVGPHTTQTAGLGVSAGDACVVRGFTGQHDFAFQTQVIQTFTDPFVYVLLAHPATVQARQVRQALRIRTALPGLAHGDGGSAVQVTVIDVSVAGALVRSPVPLGAVHAPVSLSFAVPMEDSRIALNLACAVCHSHAAPDGSGQHIGLMFSSPTPTDKLALHYLTHQGGA